LVSASFGKNFSAENKLEKKISKIADLILIGLIRQSGRKVLTENQKTRRKTTSESETKRKQTN